MKRVLQITIFFIFSFAYSQDCKINAYQALEMLGKETTVCGEVTQVFQPKYTKGNPIYLNMGEKFPNHSFTIVIWEDKRGKMKMDLLKLEGKRVAVKGMVREYEGKAQIVVKDESQIILF